MILEWADRIRCLTKKKYVDTKQIDDEIYHSISHQESAD